MLGYGLHLKPNIGVVSARLAGPVYRWGRQALAGSPPDPYYWSGRAGPMTAVRTSPGKTVALQPDTRDSACCLKATVVELSVRPGGRPNLRPL